MAAYPAFARAVFNLGKTNYPAPEEIAAISVDFDARATAKAIEIIAKQVLMQLNRHAKMQLPAHTDISLPCPLNDVEYNLQIYHYDAAIVELVKTCGHSIEPTSDNSYPSHYNLRFRFKKHAEALEWV